MIKQFKYLIRRICIYFYNKTEYFVIPTDLFSRISLNCKNEEVLKEIKLEVQELISQYPTEYELLRASAIIERMLVLKR